ncbi:MAG: hypothetical protein OHK0022_33350 [Roseiflexaceae bacterium]
MAQPHSTQPAPSHNSEPRSFLTIGLVCGLAIGLAILATVWHALPLDYRLLMALGLLLSSTGGGVAIGLFVGSVKSE